MQACQDEFENLSLCVFNPLFSHKGTPLRLTEHRYTGSLNLNEYIMCTDLYGQVG